MFPSWLKIFAARFRLRLCCRASRWWRTWGRRQHPPPFVPLFHGWSLQLQSANNFCLPSSSSRPGCTETREAESRDPWRTCLSPPPPPCPRPPVSLLSSTWRTLYKTKAGVWLRLPWAWESRRRGNRFPWHGNHLRNTLFLSHTHTCSFLNWSPLQGDARCSSSSSASSIHGLSGVWGDRISWFVTLWLLR